MDGGKKMRAGVPVYSTGANAPAKQGTEGHTAIKQRNGRTNTAGNTVRRKFGGDERHRRYAAGEVSLLLGGEPLCAMDGVLSSESRITPGFRCEHRLLALAARPFNLIRIKTSHRLVVERMSRVRHPPAAASADGIDEWN